MSCSSHHHDLLCHLRRKWHRNVSTIIAITDFPSHEGKRIRKISQTWITTRQIPGILLLFSSLTCLHPVFHSLCQVLSQRERLERDHRKRGDSLLDTEERKRMLSSRREDSFPLLVVHLSIMVSGEEDIVSFSLKTHRYWSEEFFGETCSFRWPFACFSS